MTSFDIEIPSEWDIYRISYLVSKGWKRKPHSMVSKYEQSDYYHYGDGFKEVSYCWHNEKFVNKNSVWGVNQVLITRGKSKGKYKEEQGFVDSPYFTLDQAWECQENAEG